MSVPTQHKAAILPEKGGNLQVQLRPTPTPGANEVLIGVKSISLNLVDGYQRSVGMPPVSSYPAVLGSDIAGTVLAVGANVNTFKVGARVAAFASSFYITENGTNYGAFQECVLVPAVAVAPIPDAVSFTTASALPMIAFVAATGFAVLDVELALSAAGDVKSGKKGVLVWGAGSGVGFGAVQLAKALGFAVYATAGPKHHAGLAAVGVDRTFDYGSDTVVDDIVAAAQQDGAVVELGFLAAGSYAAGSLDKCIAILAALKQRDQPSRLAVAPPMFEYPQGTGVDATFIMVHDTDKRNNAFRFAFHEWLGPSLAAETFKPFKTRVVGNGLDAIQTALEEVTAASGEKIVVDL
ncbi:hypothetical protein HK100_005630 [Physocladia obscura]|uniref:Enoyl reductase (ER) domain-containing protein n=1 Tax=Physocladia obscura TaxID=109957 RepID=A0AAD5X7Z7_9FUNG|nr:hypothetical protein HK100_005630 [Physocladia obscura]